MKTIKGPAIYLAQFAGDQSPFDSFAKSVAGPRHSATRASKLPLGIRASSTSKSGREQDVLRGTEGIAEKTGWRSPSSPRISRASSSRSIQPSTTPLMRSPLLKSGQPEKRQQWAVEQVKLGARASRNLGSQVTRHLLGWSRLAVSLSVAASASRSDRGGVQGTRRAGGSRSWTFTRSSAWMPVSSSIPARISSMARPSSGSSIGSMVISVAASTMTLRISACRTWTMSGSSTSTTSESKRFTLRTPSSLNGEARRLFRLLGLAGSRRTVPLAWRW